MFRLGHAGNGGLTLVELLITIAITSIALALAVPSFKQIREKREVTSAAEGIVTLMKFAQGEAIKRNQEVAIDWYSPGSHGSSWCVGASMAPQSVPCDCRETDTTDVDFCSIDGAPHRIVQTDFVSSGSELLHANPTSSNFSFDPLRGIMTDIPSAAEAEVLDGDWLFYLHSNSGSGNSRNFEMQIRVNVTGRITICEDDDRKMFTGGYPEC